MDIGKINREAGVLCRWMDDILTSEVSASGVTSS